MINQFYKNPFIFIELRKNTFKIPDPSNHLVVILGGSKSLQDDLTQLYTDFPYVYYDYFAVNGSIAFQKNIQHWGTLHPESFYPFVKQRQEKGWTNNQKEDYLRHSFIKSVSRSKRAKQMDPIRYVHYKWDLPVIRGSSALFSLAVSYCLGYRGAILCGVPLTGDYRKYHPRFWEWEQFMNGFAKSISGFTRLIMGYPDKEWIEEKLSKPKIFQ